MNESRLETITRIGQQIRSLRAKRKGITLGLWGNPGVGKTWTLEQVLQQTACQCFRLHATTSTMMLVLALPRAKRLPLWAEGLLERLGQGQHADTAATATALAALLAALAPVVLTLEDLHEADQERSELMVALCASGVSHQGRGFDRHQSSPAT